ncbi:MULTISPECIES: hypothetical protein [unclassified Pedobacter]|nr:MULTISPECIES: hypothetical protein [unclassified Pedobacter]
MEGFSLTFFPPKDHINPETDSNEAATPPYHSLKDLADLLT